MTLVVAFCYANYFASGNNDFVMTSYFYGVSFELTWGWNLFIVLSWWNWSRLWSRLLSWQKEACILLKFRLRRKETFLSFFPYFHCSQIRFCFRSILGCFSIHASLTIVKFSLLIGKLLNLPFTALNTCLPKHWFSSMPLLSTISVVLITGVLGAAAWLPSTKATPFEVLNFMNKWWIYVTAFSNFRTGLPRILLYADLLSLEHSWLLA